MQNVKYFIYDTSKQLIFHVAYKTILPVVLFLVSVEFENEIGQFLPVFSSPKMQS